MSEQRDNSDSGGLTLLAAARRAGCAFCGSRPLTREHVWPDWLRKLIAPDAVTHRRTTEVEFSVVEDREYPSRPFNVTVRAVCAECNSGWMSRLEERAKPLLLPGLHGRGKQLAAGGQETLATWAFKTALVFGKTLRDRPAMPDEHYRHLFEHQRPPEQCVIWMGAYGGPRAGFLQAAGMAISRRGELLDSGSRPNIYVCTITIGPLFFQVLSGSDAEAFDVTTVRWGDPRIRVIWPVGETFTWSPQRALGSHELQPYADAIYDELNRALSSAPSRPR